MKDSNQRKSRDVSDETYALRWEPTIHFDSALRNPTSLQPSAVINNFLRLVSHSSQQSSRSLQIQTIKTPLTVIKYLLNPLKNTKIHAEQLLPTQYNFHININHTSRRIPNRKIPRIEIKHLDSYIPSIYYNQEFNRLFARKAREGH